MPTCYLIGAGEFTVRGFYPAEGDCIIAADDGYSVLQSLGYTPDLLVGDFDSLQRMPAGIPRKSFPREKDDTDMALALAEGIARGYRAFCFYGASGGREDHTCANLQLLGGASRQGFACKMVCPAYDVTAVTNDTLVMPVLKQGTIVSVFCHGDKAEGVTLRGMHYPLTDALLTCDHPIGVSNQTSEAKISVTVRKGTLLVYVMHDAVAIRTARREKEIQ